MKNEDLKSKKDSALRKRAEEKLKSLNLPIANLSDADLRAMAHELQVHEIELEMQNEELRKDQMVIADISKKYTDLYDFAPIGYFTLDEAGLILEANLTGSEMLGMERQLLIGKPLGCFVVKDDNDILYLHRRRVFETQEKQICEIRMFHKQDNTQFHAKLESSVAHDSVACSNRLWVIISDISKQKEAEKEINKLSCAIEQSPTSVIITDPKGNIEYVNPQFTKTTGYSKEEVIGENPRILKSGRNPHDFYMKLWSTITAGYEWKGRFSNRKKNGDIYWEYQSISPVKDDKGNITNFIAVKIDETERVKAEEEALKAGRQFARILEISLDAIITADEKQRIVIFNKGAEHLFCYTSAEIKGKPLDMLLPERFKGMHGKHMEDFSKSEITFKRLNDRHYQLFGLRKSGDEFPAEIAISKYREDGKTMFSAVIQDITERRKMENDRFRAQKLESVGVLAGGIAHDFNNILTAILGNTNLAEILLKSGNYDQLQETHTNIEKAAGRARDLAQQLLTFSKGGEPIKKTAHLIELIKDAAEFATRGSNVKCEFSLPDDLWPVEADEGQINQVINNLVINAAHAMPKGGVVKVSAENCPKISKDLEISLTQGRYIMISVKDYGFGIKEEHLANIFDPYFTTKQKGSGLGLASSYSIIIKHNGLITVNSKAGEGSTFYIYLPASSNEISNENEKEDKPLAGAGKVLIMDDDEAIRYTANQTLSFIGYEVECANNGKEAIEMYKTAKENGAPFDVVLMDLTIPDGMGGKDTIIKLREFDHAVKAIVMSGYSNDPIMSDYKRHGFNGFVSKPFMIQALNEELQNVIKGITAND